MIFLKKQMLVTLEYNINVIPVYTELEVVKYLQTFLNDTSNPDLTVNIQYNESILNSVMQFPCCSNEATAKKILETFGSISNIGNATEEELTEIEKFGPKKSQQALYIF